MLAHPGFAWPTMAAETAEEEAPREVAAQVLTRVAAPGGAEDAAPREAEVVVQTVSAALAVAEVVGGRLGTYSLVPRLLVVLLAAVDAAVDVWVAVVDVEAVTMKIMCMLTKDTRQRLLMAWK